MELATAGAKAPITEGEMKMKMKKKKKKKKKEQAQLRRDKATAKKLGTVADQLRRMGFNADGFGWQPRGNSFAVRDRLKALGGTWNGSTWTVPVEPDFIESDRVAASDCTVIEERGELLKFEYVRWRWC